jgi:hypothetical protein
MEARRHLMKTFFTLSICALLFSPLAGANGEGLTIREEAQGTAEIDEEYLEAMDDRKPAREKQQQTNKTRERMESNPRNPAMVESFEEVSQERYEKIKEKKQKEVKEP